MRMAMRNGHILIKEADATQFAIIKSWGKMKWSRAEQLLSGPIDHELLERLSKLIRLPAEVEAERLRLNKLLKAIDIERMKETPEPIYKYPVKMNLYSHQTRAANMAMMIFELAEPIEEKKEEKDDNNSDHIGAKECKTRPGAKV